MAVFWIIFVIVILLVLFSSRGRAALSWRRAPIVIWGPGIGGGWGGGGGGGGGFPAAAAPAAAAAHRGW